MKSLNEFYQTYADYNKQLASKKSAFGTPEDLKQDAINSITSALPKGEKEIDEITDESTEKGIKFKIKVGKDVIHMYKTGRMRFEWEYYLNKKKSSKYDISEYLHNRGLSKIDIVVRTLKGYDFYTAYIDDGRQYRQANDRNREIKKIFDDLSSSDKVKVVKQLIKDSPNQEKEINNVFRTK
jgi:hypothetical protein